jgi:uncharacterized protein (DUF433 family)
VYHSVSGSSKRIVTIQFPEAQIVLNFDHPVKDSDGHVYPSITVFSRFAQGETEEYLDSFFRGLSIEDIFNAICVDDWRDNYWLENATKEDVLAGRSFLTTFVNLASLDQGQTE